MKDHISLWNVSLEDRILKTPCQEDSKSFPVSKGYTEGKTDNSNQANDQYY